MVAPLSISSPRNGSHICSVVSLQLYDEPAYVFSIRPVCELVQFVFGQPHMAVNIGTNGVYLPTSQLCFEEEHLEENTTKSDVTSQLKYIC